jgi:RND family efflux transporter MFP subunit
LLVRKNIRGRIRSRLSKSLRSPLLGSLRLACVLPAALATALCALALASCNRSAAPPPPTPKVTVAHPVERDLTDWDEYTARLEAIDSVEVRARVSGYLESVKFREGSVVKKGDLLFLIDPRPYEAQLRRAEGDLELGKSRLDIAQKNLARVAYLVKSQAMSKEEAETRAAFVRQAEAGVATAQAAVDAARLDVEFTRVTAPVTGRVSRKLVTEGNLINGGVGTQGTLLTTIVSLDPLYVYFEANERDYLKYVRLAKSGERPSSREYKNPVQIGLADEKGFPHEGYMDFMDNQKRAIVPNTDGLLAPGLFVRLRLIGSGRYKALLIPDEAVQSDQAEKFVWVIDGDNKVHYRKVTCGSVHDGLRVVREGLTPDDRVIVKGIQRARPDIVVEAEEEELTPPTATAAGPPPAPLDAQ